MTIKLNRRQALITLGSAAALSTLAVPVPVLANTKIKVGALRFTSHSPTFIALQRGYFKEAGLDVELSFFQAAQPMAVAIASGDIDYAVTAITGGLINLADKGAIKVIGGALSEEQGIDGNTLLASNAAYEAGLTTPKQLDGKTFGITQTGSSFHYMGAKIAAAEGVQLKYKPLQKVGAIIGALKSGQIDAWAIVPHIAKALTAADAVKVIGKVANYIPNYQVTTVFTSTTNATQERARTEAFINAFSRGVADFNAALVDKTEGEAAAEEMVKLIHQYVYADRPYEKAQGPIRNGAMRISKEATLNIASIQDQLDWFKAEGLVKESIMLDTLIDSSYVATA